MKTAKQGSKKLTRREFLGATGSAGGALALGPAVFQTAGGAATRASAAMTNQDADRRYNILFLLTDQERYFDPATLPDG